jgi:hypothetical protein
VRARLTQAILLVVAGTLVLTAIGSLVLIRRSTYDSAEQQLYSQAKVVASLAVAQDQPGAGVLSLSDTLRLVGGYDTLKVASLSPDGSFSGLPPSLQENTCAPVSCSATSRWPASWAAWSTC